jgi:hypothetical protein
MNSRQKGKRGERDVVHSYRSIFPNIQRNYNEQSAKGGIDFLNTDPFDIESKCGKQCKIVKVRGWIDQVQKEGSPQNFKVVRVKPDNEKPYVILPEDDFLELLEVMRREGIINLINSEEQL